MGTATIVLIAMASMALIAAVAAIVIKINSNIRKINRTYKDKDK